MNRYFFAAIKTLAGVFMGCLLWVAFPLHAETTVKSASTDNFSDAVFQGSMDFGLQARFADVNTNVAQDISALTFRTRLAYQTKHYRNTRFSLELEDVRVVGGIDPLYALVQSGYATLNDPETTEINKAYFEYSGFPRDHLTLGRQALVLDDGRFIGNQPWRQNEQTFDAFVVRNGLFKRIPLLYAFIGKQHDSLARMTDVSNHVLHASYTHPHYGRMSLFGLFFTDDITLKSSITLGGTLSLTQPLKRNLKTFYELKLASQKARNSRVNYVFIKSAVTLYGVTSALSYEVLGSDNGAYGFQTPLGSTDVFNGWSDVFERVPKTGLRDVALLSSGSFKGVDLTGVYHRFFSAHQRIVYGTEIDLMVIKKFDTHNSVGFKYATYRSRRDALAVDHSKWWVWFKFES